MDLPWRTGADHVEGSNLDDHSIGGSPEDFQSEGLPESPRMRVGCDPRLFQADLRNPGIRQVPPLREEDGRAEISHDMAPTPSNARGGRELRESEESEPHRSEMMLELHIL